MGHGIFPRQHIVKKIEKRFPRFCAGSDLQIDLLKLAGAFPDAGFRETVHQFGIDGHAVIVGELESLEFFAQAYLFKVRGGKVDFFLYGDADDGVVFQLFEHLSVHHGVFRNNQLVLVAVDILTDYHAVFQCHAGNIFHRKYLRFCGAVRKSGTHVPICSGETVCFLE